mmetsp:Transcript_9473/g.18278  ORF Transcript_9473/g.18278 Transcript_9473/m.18278 type:complete len:638 (+) Transcript_9473:1923-3836(+)
MRAWLQRGFKSSPLLWTATELNIKWKGMNTSLPAVEEYSEVLASLQSKATLDPFLLRIPKGRLLVTDIDYYNAYKKAQGPLELTVEELGKGNIPHIVPGKSIEFKESSRPLEDIIQEADRLLNKEKTIEACRVLQRGLTQIVRSDDLTEELQRCYSLYVTSLHLADKEEEVERLVGFIEYFYRTKKFTLTRPAAEAYFILSLYYLEEEQTDSALELLEKAATFEGESDEDYETRVMICFRLAEIFEEAEEFNQCRIYAQKAWGDIEKASKTNEVVAGRIIHLMAKCDAADQNFEEACIKLEKAMQIYNEAEDPEIPYTAAAYKDYGTLCFELKRFEEAVKALKRAGELLDDLDTEAANQSSIPLIESLLQLNRGDEAEAEVNKALARPTDEHSVRLKLCAALVYKDQKRTDEALRMATEAKKELIDQDIPDEEESELGQAHILLGQMQLDAGNLTEAESELLNAVDYYKDKDEEAFDLFTAYNALTRVHYQAEDLEKAYTYGSSAVKLANENDDFDPESVADSYDFLAKVMVEQGKTEGVKELFKKTLKLRIKHQGPSAPELLPSYANYGSFLLETNDLIKAEVALLKALQIVRESSLSMSSPEVKLVFELLLNLYKAKDDSDAVQRLERVMSELAK